jgi:NADPH:quinone reductase-like Zn-dependent oxidoreductase
MTIIKKVVITGFGDESKLALMETDLPPPRKEEVQIAVQYTVVCGSDVNMRRGTYPFQRKPPLTPGYSVVGTVRLNGPVSARFDVGDRVACLTKYDGQAELVNQPERYLVRVPDGANPKLAVALVLDWLTAYQMLHHAAHLKPGQRLFVHGLSGGVGGALLALGRIEATEVFGTASAAKHAALRELGAIPFDYVDKKWIAHMRASGGVDAVFDPLGYQSFDESYSILRPGGLGLSGRERCVILLESRPVPVRCVGCGLIGALQERQEGRLRIPRVSNLVIGKQELT